MLYIMPVRVNMVRDMLVGLMWCILYARSCKHGACYIAVGIVVLRILNPVVQSVLSLFVEEEALVG